MGGVMRDRLAGFIQLNRVELIVLAIALAMALLTGMIFLNFGEAAGVQQAAISSADGADSGSSGPYFDQSAGLQDRDMEWVDPATGEAPQSTAPGSGDDNEQPRSDGYQGQSPPAQQSPSGTVPGTPGGNEPSPGDQGSTPPAAGSVQAGNIRVTLVIDSGDRRLEFPVEIQENSTVFELLEQASSEHGFSFGYSNNASYGVFVEELDGVKNSPRASKYWMYYVNGSYAGLGASSQLLSKGDVILWRYETSR